MATSRMAFFEGVPLPGAETVDPHYLPPPAAWLALTEFQRVAVDVISLATVRQLLNKLPRGDGHPVMVLPGFLASDAYNASFRRFLGSLGYAVHGWGLGRNLGPRDAALTRLMERLHTLADRYGQPLTLVGHSLGGIFARELAREEPSLVRQVVSLGSPFGRGRMSGSYPARLFAALNPSEDIPVVMDELHWAPPVPTTAIYSKGDGIVNWRTAVQSADYAPSVSQNIRVRGSHCGMTLNPSVWYIVADRLRQSVDDWQPFSTSGLGNLLIPQHE
ncbi:MAG: pimeloyl-ACP methyl ester carboxylesterase [Halieaceae bacterium]|jgi:pimeloyl-ACP methyl ester carboxylesterase